MSVAIPHFALPFRFVSPGAGVTDQDSLDEIAYCVYAILVCPLGFRVESPLFGNPDQTFAMPAPDLDMIRNAVETWEPRAAALLAEHPDLIDELVARVEVLVQIRSEA
jgi:phage baseplate assembly protein W